MKDELQILEKKMTHLRPAGYGITVVEFSKKKGIPPETARRLMMKLCDEGILKRETMLHNGRAAIVYSKAK